MVDRRTERPEVTLSLAMLWGIAGWTALAQGMWLLSGWFWWAEAFDHGLVVGGLLAAFGALLAALWRRLLFVAAFGAAIIVDAARWVPAAIPDPRGGEPVKILVANVLSTNRNQGSLLRLIEEERPDLIGLLEVNGGWMAALAPLREEYPFYLEHPRTDNFGLALYSRLPIPEPRIAWIGSQQVPTITATLPGEISFLLVHPPPPLSPELATVRRNHLQALGALLAAADGRYIAAGDLNAAPWAASFPNAPVRGSLPWGTYPSWWGLPLDHVLAGAAIGVDERRVGPAIGSDHRPVIARLRLPE